LTKHNDIIKPLLRGASHLGLALGPALAKAGPANKYVVLENNTHLDGVKMFLWNFATLYKKKRLTPDTYHIMQQGGLIFQNILTKPKGLAWHFWQVKK